MELFLFGLILGGPAYIVVGIIYVSISNRIGEWERSWDTHEKRLKRKAKKIARLQDKITEIEYNDKV